MKRILAIALTLMFVLSMSTVAMADWGKCKGCHNGKVAPDEAALKAKFTDAAAFVAGAEASTNAMMKSQQGDKAALEKAAADIGLK